MCFQLVEATQLPGGTVLAGLRAFGDDAQVLVDKVFVYFESFQSDSGLRDEVLLDQIRNVDLSEGWPGHAGEQP